MATDPSVPAPLSYQDLLAKKGTIEQQMKVINDRGNYLDQQYNANHYGGKSQGEFQAIRAGAMAGLSPLQKELDELKISMQSAQEQNQREEQRQSALTQRKELQERLLGRLPGLEQEMGDSLLNQQNYAYAKIQPMIEQRLNAMGILQSGALGEGQAKAFGDLENARQGRLADFGMNARQMLELNYPMEYTGQDIGAQEGNVNAMIDLSRAGLQRGFATDDIEKQYAYQNQMNQQALEEARAARDQYSRDSLRNGLIQGGFSLAGAGVKGAMMSDLRLKKNIERKGEARGLPVYSFEYRADEFPQLDLPTGPQVGFMAHEVERLYPDAVSTTGGYKQVNYAYVPGVK